MICRECGGTGIRSEFAWAVIVDQQGQVVNGGPQFRYCESCPTHPAKPDDRVAVAKEITEVSDDGV